MRTTEKAPTILTAEGARRLTGKIRDALALADDLLVRAYEGRAWEALGHADFAEYCAKELPEMRLIKLRAPARRERAAKLLDLGASEREIAAATGASNGTAHNDVAFLTGRSKMSTPAVADQHVSRVAEALARVKAQGSRGLTSVELDRETGWPMGTATGSLSKLERRGLVRRLAVKRNNRMAYVEAGL